MLKVSRLMSICVLVTDPQHQQRFEHWLCEVNSSDGISLLTALAQMATATRHYDPSFITTITLLIYQVCQGRVSGQPKEDTVFITLLHKYAVARFWYLSFCF